jgi:hypothetical protein
MESISSFPENGFRRKAAQPEAVASLRTLAVSSAVIYITGTVEPLAVKRRRVSMPDMPPK